MSPVKKEMGQRSRAISIKQHRENSGGAGEGNSESPGCEVRTDPLVGPGCPHHSHHGSAFRQVDLMGRPQEHTLHTLQAWQAQRRFHQ